MKTEVEGHMGWDEAGIVLSGVVGHERWAPETITAVRTLLMATYRDAYCDGVVEAVTASYDIDDLDQFIDATDVPNADNE